MNDKVQAKNRIGWIDIAKAIGILFVLINHAELGLGIVTFLGGMFYMPVFFVLSGYTYRDNHQESIKTFALNKAKRLLIPYVWFQITLIGLYAVRSILSGQSFSKLIIPIVGAFYSRNALFPKSSEVVLSLTDQNIDLMTALNAPLWFLTGLFSTLLIYKLIMTLAKNNARREWIYLCISVLFGILLKYFCPVLLPWSMDTAFVSVAFIHMGKLMKQKNVMERLSHKPIYTGLILVIFVLASYVNGSVNMSIREFGHSVLLYLLVGGTGSLIIMVVSKFIEEYIRAIGAGMEHIGRHTIGILAFHLIIFGLVDAILQMAGITDGVIEKVAKIIIAVVILVPTDLLLQKYLPFVYGINRRNK